MKIYASYLLALFFCLSACQSTPTSSTEEGETATEQEVQESSSDPSSEANTDGQTSANGSSDESISESSTIAAPEVSGNGVNSPSDKNDDIVSLISKQWMAAQVMIETRINPEGFEPMQWGIDIRRNGTFEMINIDDEDSKGTWRYFPSSNHTDSLHFSVPQGGKILTRILKATPDTLYLSGTIVDEASAEDDEFPGAEIILTAK